MATARVTIEINDLGWPNDEIRVVASESRMYRSENGLPVAGDDYVQRAIARATEMARAAAKAHDVELKL